MSTLERLAAEGVNTIPRQSHSLGAERRQKRLEFAAGATQQSSLLLTFFTWGSGMFFVAAILLVATGATAPPTSFEKGFLAVWGALQLIATVILVTTNRRADAANARTLAAFLEFPTSLPFPTDDGFAELAVADRPLVDVVLTKPIDASTFTNAARAIDPAIEVEAIDERTVRLALPPIVFPSDPIERWLDVRLLRRLIDQMLIPLHGESGIERLRFGGTVTLG